MTKLADLITRQILEDGPMSLASYMQLCLLHPQHGYYATRDPLGAEGDFTTAPEISQMFGELLGLALAQAWIDQGKPSDPILVELGPGRGTLMRDMLRATGGVAGFAPKIYLVEASATLRKVQADTLANHDVTWVEGIDNLPDTPIFLVANEFFDALPIQQYQRNPNGWSERRISASEGFAFGLTEPRQVAALAHRLEDTKPGDIVEICPQAGPILEAISRRIEAHGGGAIIVDYGDWRSLGDTFQAVQNHAPVSPFETPGEADLTAHVDFEALSRAANCKVSDMVTQGVLLERLGIVQRAQALARNLSDTALENHIAGFERLTHPEKMGHLFKAIALTPRSAPDMPGFAP